MYRNEEDGKDLWYSTGYVGGDKWVIGDTAGTGAVTLETRAPAAFHLTPET